MERYFELRCAATRGDSFAAVSDDVGLFLTLREGKKVEYPGTFHVSFAQESEEKVDEINQRLKDDPKFTIEVLGADDPQFLVN